MAYDDLYASLPTVLLGDFEMKAPSDSTDAGLIIEGLYHDGKISYFEGIKNVQIIKCRLREFTPYSGSISNVSISFIQCRVNFRLRLADNSTMTCINSYINTPRSMNKTSSNFDMQNCIIYYQNGNDFIETSTLNNCIIVPAIKYSTNFPSSNQVLNCIAVGDCVDDDDNFFIWLNNPTNKVIAGYKMFKTFTGTWDDKADFVLTDEAAKTYLGSDGTQVGIYGGMLPYEETLNIPRITKFNVASKSTADGKLSVDIQVGVNE